MTHYYIKVRTLIWWFNAVSKKSYGARKEMDHTKMVINCSAGVILERTLDNTVNRFSLPLSWMLDGW